MFIHCTLSLIVVVMLSLGIELSVLGQDFIQPIALQAIFELEALCKLVEFLFRLSSEIIRPLEDENLAHHDRPSHPRHALVDGPNGIWVQFQVLLIVHIVYHQIDERIEDAFNGCVVSAPAVKCKSVFLGKEWLEEFHVRRVSGDVDHALEPDVLVKPDRPTQTVLKQPQ